MSTSKIDLFINCPICNKTPYYYERHDLIKCKTCKYSYYFYKDDINFSIKFDRRHEIVYIDVTYDSIYLKKYLYKIEYFNKSNYCGTNQIDFESDVFLNKKQINKIIDNQIFA